MDFKDYYAILGVTKETPVDEMKRAYRKLARKYHPDVSKLPDAEARFKEVNEAWEVLQDPQKRKQYDQLQARGTVPPDQGFNQAYGSDFYSGDHPEDFSFQTEENLNDFFQNIFRGAGAAHSAQSRSIRGEDLQVKIHIPLETAYAGGVQSIQLEVPTITADGKKSLQTKTLQVKIPAGVTQGSRIRLKGQGSPGWGKAPAGDLYIEIALARHAHFTWQEKDIHLKLPIAPWEAALGANISVPTLGGVVALKIPPHSQSGQTLRLKGRGLPGDPAGDQLVLLQIMVPQADTEKAKQVYQEMANAMPFHPRKELGV